MPFIQNQHLYHLYPDFYSNSGHVCLVISSPPNEQELSVMTLSNYNSNENANYDSNENADYEPSKRFHSQQMLV